MFLEKRPIFCVDHSVRITRMDQISKSQNATASHCNGVIMGAMASQITRVSIVCSTVCPCAEQRKHQSSASLVFVRGTHRWPVDSPHKGQVTRKMFPFDGVIMISHNTPFRAEMCTFLFWMVCCGIWGRCIVGFVRLVYSMWWDWRNSCHEHVTPIFRNTVDNKNYETSLTHRRKYGAGSSVQLDRDGRV